MEWKQPQLAKSYKFNTKRMKKIFSLLLIVLCASLSAGFYGSIHDMVTFRISPEYYTHYKFIEFGLIENYDQQINNPELMAATVGFMATWWVGFFISIIIGGLVLKFSNPNTKQLIAITVFNTLIILAITCICGILGWLFGTFISSDAEDISYMQDAFLKPDEAKQITVVSYMHSFGYIGSVIGFTIAVMRTFKLKSN